MTDKLATVVVRSKNRKLGNVAATYVTLDSCPSDCAFKGAGCYAETGYVGIQTKRFGRGNPLTVARQEAKAIREAIPQALRLRPHGGQYGLRLHVSGDARTIGAARILAKVATLWRKAFGVRPWTYTHAWRKVDRASWGPDTSVLASVETGAQGAQAWDRGYVPAIVVAAFPRGAKPFRVGDDGPSYIPCPAQTRGRTCDQCRLCWSDHSLRLAGKGIAFEAHGSGAKAVKRALTVVNS